MIIYEEGEVVLLHVLLSGHLIQCKIDLHGAQVLVYLGQRQTDLITHITNMLGSEDGFFLG
jgi:hypothetical protein